MARTKAWNGTGKAAYNSGYDVATTRMQASDAGANCYLVDESDHTHVLLHVTDIATNLGLSGSTAQSRLTRDFYSRNFQQVAWTITAQAPSQKHIGLVAEFVRKSQRNCIAKNGLMGLIFPGGGLQNTAGALRSQGMRGVHKSIHMSGYVDGMPREHKRHDPAPDYTFNFVVAHMRTGPFKDTPYVEHALPKWSEIVRLLEGNFVKPPKTVEEEIADEETKKAVEGIREIIDVASDVFGAILGE